jgi:TolB-like protein/Tfp pilus assembly protein PilF
MSLLGELKRRNVFRVSILYLVAGWVLLQVADILFPALDIPEWGINLILGLLILGFPLVVIFSWVYELTPEGIKRERDIDRSESITHTTGHKINALIVILLLVAIGVVAVDRLVPESHDDDTASSTTQTAPPTRDEGQASSEEPGTVAEPAEIAAGMFLNTAPEQSVAVLPFVNMSGDAENEYFSDGLSEELLNALAGLDGLFVAARTSSFHFKGHTGDVGDMARQLKVRNILEGSVRKAGTRVRITAQLIDATNGYHLWSETFDRQLDDVFAVQDEISREVAGALKVTLLSEEDALVEKPTENMDAYLAYLRGQQHLHAGGTDGYKRAVEAFEEAVTLDPEFAEAHAGIAMAWANQLEWGNIDRDEAIGPIKTAADRAMGLDPDLPTALTAHATAILVSRLNNEVDPRVLKTLEQALAVDPDDVQSLDAYANALQQAGRNEEALEPLERGLARDPLSADLQMSLARVLSSLERFEAARQRFLSAMELAPDHPQPPDGMAFIERGLGHYGEAIKWQVRVIDRDPADTFSRLVIASDYVELGDLQRAAAWLGIAEQMQGRAGMIASTKAALLWHQGDRDEAVAVSEAAFAAQPEGQTAPGFTSPILFGHYLSTGAFERAIAVQFDDQTLPESPQQGVRLRRGQATDLAHAALLIGKRDGRAAGDERVTQLLEWVDAADESQIQPRAAQLLRCSLQAMLERAEAAVRECRAAQRLDQQWLALAYPIGPTLDPIRDTPQWRSFMDEIRADRARQLAQFRASGEEPAPR